jgi:type IV fimbrial biogenesis protein FimT
MLVQMKPKRVRVAGRSAMGMRRLAARGFTLIELLVVFVLLAVMLALAAPNFITFQRNAELTSSANSFVAALSAARAEAMKRQLRTFVVPVSGNNWASGWRVFVDIDSDVTAGSVTPSSSDTIVSEQGALPGTVAITASSFGDGTTAYVMFNGSGFATLIDKTFQDGSIEMTNGTESRRVIVNPNGRFRVCKPTEAGCTESAL